MSDSFPIDDPRSSDSKTLRCPHCYHPLPLRADRTEEVVCPGCGSSFRLRDEPLVTTTAEIKTLGRFQLMEKVGTGTFGAVWRARDPELDRLVAIKVLHPSLVSSTADRERFQREARAAARLRHPGIVTVHEVATLNDMPAIISDFVDGVTLREFLQVRKLTFPESAELVAQVADALDYAHQMGVVHRDIKPANIMIELSPGRGLSAERDAPSADGPRHSRLGAPRLLDFGLALRDETEITMTIDGQILGTPAYMSPEQAAGLGHNVDRRSDVYSLGVLLYELLTGELPFRGTTGMLRFQVLNDEPRPPRRINDKIPRDLETICLKAMAKEPARRYATARDLADDLRRYLRGEPIVARPVSQAERLVHWCKRNPVVAGLTAGVVTLLITATVAAFVAAAWFRGLADDRERAREQAVNALGNEKKARKAAQDAEANEQAQHQLYKQLAEKNRLQVYAARINVAHQAWQRGDTARVLDLLQSLQPAPGQEDLRGFEWYYLWRLCHGELQTLRGHVGAVRQAAFAPDGKTLASAGDDGLVKLWDVASGRERRTLRGHTGPVSSVAFSPEGTPVATASFDRTVRLWDSASGSLLATLTHPDPVSCLAFSPNGHMLATGTGILGIEGGNPLVRFVGGAVKGEVSLWNVSDAKRLATLKGHESHVFATVVSPDGRTIASASADGTVRLWDVTDQKQVANLSGQGGIVCSLAFAPDGQTLAAGGGDPYLGLAAVRLWDVKQRKVRTNLQGHAGLVFTVAFAPDGKTLATGSFDQTVRLWDLEKSKERASFRGHTDRVLSACISPDETLLATASKDGTVRLWNANRRPEADVLKGRRDIGGATGAYTTAFAPDGKLLASATYVVKLWNPETGEEVRVLDGYQNHDISVAFSPNGRLLAAAGIDGNIKLWDPATGKELSTLRGDGNKVWSLTFTPDSQTLITGGDGGIVRFWDVRENREQRQINADTDQVRFLALTPDGTILATCGPEKRDKVTVWTKSVIKLWDRASGKLRATYSGHSNVIEWIAFSPDGKTFATGSWDRTVKLWDMASGKELNTLIGHMDTVYHGTFSPDGKTLATASWDGTVRLWHVATGQELLSYRGSGGVLWHVAFSRDGRLLATGSGSRQVGEITLFRAASQLEDTPLDRP